MNLKNTFNSIRNQNYLIVIILIILTSCKSGFSGLDYESIENEEFNNNLVKDLDQNIFTDSIDIAMIESQFPKKGYLTVDYTRNLKINLLRNAKHITKKSNYSYYDNNGLAYLWGGKNHNRKLVPSNVNDRKNRCQEPLYGLDCSGFVYQLFLLSDLKITHPTKKAPEDYANAEYLSKPKNWRKALSEYADNSNAIKVRRINNLKVEEIQSGDVIFFYKPRKEASHIGICLWVGNNETGELVFFDSSGFANNTCENAIARGPRRSVLTQNLLNRWKKKYGIIRLTNND